MNPLEPHSEGQLNPNDVVAMLVAVVRAHGMQEANGRGSKVIVDSHDLSYATALVRQGSVQIYRLDSDVALNIGSPPELDLIRFVIEVRE